MRIKQTIKTLIVALMIILPVFVVTAAPDFASAACDPATQSCCGGVETSIVKCDETGGDNAPVENTGVWGILLLAINILTAGVGVVAVAGIVYASILYASSSGEPEKTKKAMTIISDIVIGVIAYALMYTALNFLMPGGLFT